MDKDSLVNLLQDNIEEKLKDAKAMGGDLKNLIRSTTINTLENFDFVTKEEFETQKTKFECGGRLTLSHSICHIMLATRHSIMRFRSLGMFLFESTKARKVARTLQARTTALKVWNTIWS